MKFALRRNFQFQPGLKKIGVTNEFQPRAKRKFFYYISPRGENIFAKICGISNKNATCELDVSYAVAGLYKNYDVRFH